MSFGMGRGGSAGRFRRVYDGTSETLRVARNDVVEWLSEHGFDQDLRDRAALVLSELATNAIQASPGRAYTVRLTLPADRSAVVAVTSHVGHEQLPPRAQWGPASLLAPRGRGLLIVGEVAEDVTVDLPSRNSVVVTATLRSSLPE